MPSDAATFKITACSADHIGDRQDQQDRVAVLTSRYWPGSLLALVADGMGGRTGGRLASDQVIATARNLFDDRPEAGMDGRGLLGAIVSEAHTVIRLTAVAAEKEPHSTLVALLVQGRRADWVHVGDSRLLHFLDGALLHRTIDHSYGSTLNASGALIEGGPERRRFRSVLFSALGARSELRIDYGEADGLRAGDSFVLASDGLWTYVKEPEMASLLQDLPAREAAQRMVDLARARARGKGDNLSLVVIKMEPA